MKTIVQQTTFIPNQQKSSFTSYRNLIITVVNKMIDYNNQSIKNESNKTNHITNDKFKSRDELNQFIKEIRIKNF